MPDAKKKSDAVMTLKNETSEVDLLHKTEKKFKRGVSEKYLRPGSDVKLGEKCVRMCVLEVILRTRQREGRAPSHLLSSEPLCCECIREEKGMGRRKSVKTNRRTRAESQQIVAQRPLSCLQYLVLYLSRIQRICLSRYLNLLFSIV